MSEWVQCETQITDFEMLKEALVTVGIREGAIQVSETGFEMHGYYASSRADVLVAKRDAGSKYDVGFVRDAEGNYKALVYSGDYSGLAEVINTGKLKQCYARSKILKTIREQISRGEVVSEEDVAGKIRIRVKVPEY